MGRMSRNKGKVGEREAAGLWNKVFGFEAHRAQQFCGKAGDADLKGVPVHCEVKRVERLNLSAAMDQAIEDSNGELPVVMHRKSREPWLLTVRFEDLPELVAMLASRNPEREETGQ